MGNLPEEFGGVAFLLERVGLRVGTAEDGQRLGLNLISLALARRIDQYAFYAYAAAGGERRGRFMAGIGFIDHYLKVLEGGAVGDLEEGDQLRRPAGLDPTLDKNVATGLFLDENILDFGALH
jgi:hypothetical protein